MRLRLLGKTRCGVGVEIQNIRKVKESRPDYSKDGNAARLNHFRANSENRLHSFSTLDGQQGRCIFREKIELAFKRQAAVQVPIEAAAEAREISAAQI